MKKKDLSELKSKSAPELGEKLAQLEKEITKESLELRLGKVKNVHSAANRRKDIARLNTLIKIGELAGNFKESNVKAKEEN